MVPLECFAGQDLLQIHTKHQEKGIERRRTLQAKFNSMRDVRPLVQPANAPEPNTKQPSTTETASECTADDYEQSKEEDDLSKQGDVVTVAKEGGESNNEDKVTEGPQSPTSSRGPVVNDQPTEPKHDAFCDGCAVRVLLLQCCFRLLCVHDELLIFRTGNSLSGLIGDVECV